MHQSGGLEPPSPVQICQAELSTNNSSEQQLAASLETGSELIEQIQALPLTKLAQEHLFGPARWLETQIDYYMSDIWAQTGDERILPLPFMSSPWKVLAATTLYLYLIKILLPKIMRRVKHPYELSWLIRGYNLGMVFGNVFGFYHGVRILHWGAKCFGCEVINSADRSAQAIELLHFGWLFLMSRLVEWLDTIFFVLRKRERQVTKLHVFHHTFVPLISWTYLKYHPGYTMAFFPLVNSFVHSIMYSYYFLATFGPKIQPYLWWKRYLTSLQIVQFVLILLQLATIPLSADEKCQYPRGFFYFAYAGAVLFLWLFYIYYVDTYKSVDRNRSNNKRERQAERKREGFSRALDEVLENTIGDVDKKSN